MKHILMNWDQKSYLLKMMGACENRHINRWKAIRHLAEREFRSLLLMIEWAEKMKSTGEFNIEQARVHIALQKSTMYLRFQEVSGLSFHEAADVMNNALSSVRKDLHDQVEWVVI